LSAESEAEWADEWAGEEDDPDSDGGEGQTDGDEDDGDEESQPPPGPPATPPAPATPPTGSTLQWSHFRVVATPPRAGGEDAQIGYTRAGSGQFTFDVPTVLLVDGMYYASWGSYSAGMVYSVRFNPATSWVVRGNQDAGLLEHERLHLLIAEYVAQKISAKYPTISGHGSGAALTREEALSKARADAAAQLKARFDQVVAEWARIDTAVQTRYDAQTMHGSDPFNQLWWKDDYKAEVDKEFPVGP